MSTHLDQLITDWGMSFEPAILPDLAEKGVLLPPVGLTLRRLDIDKSAYSPDGKYYQTTVVLRNWAAEGLESLFGFDEAWDRDPEIATMDEALRAKIDYQLSNDNGVTWYVWVDGPDAWLPATGIYLNTYNPGNIVDLRSPLLPLITPKQVRIKARLTPSTDGRQRPILRGVSFYNDHKMDFYEDITRSLKRYIDTSVQVPMFYFAELATAASTITIATEPGLEVTITEPIQVYNTTTDPGRLINLFSSLSGRVVTMLGPQIGNMEVRFTGVPDVFIGAEDFFQISKIPSIVVTVTSIEQYVDLRSWKPEVERNRAKGLGRLQFFRVFYYAYATVRVQSSLKREALQMIDACARILDKSDHFFSVATGETYCIMSAEREVSEDRVAQGLFVCGIDLKIMGMIWLKGILDDLDEPNLRVENGVIPLIKDVNIMVTAQNTCNLNIPSYLRRIYVERI
jgi:hypothetical protein